MSYIKLVYLVIPLIIFSTLGAFAFYEVRNGPEINQPFDMSHKYHVKDLAMKCEECHVGVRTTYASTRPKIQTCLSCKDEILEGGEKSKGFLAKKKKGTLKKHEQTFMEYLQKEKPIIWKPVYKLKRHVYFSHFRHVTAGKINCKTCHGDYETIETMPKRPIIETFFMYTCMDCHEEKGVTNDCMACHR